jgi:hypothetical protein
VGSRWHTLAAKLFWDLGVTVASGFILTLLRRDNQLRTVAMDDSIATASLGTSSFAGVIIACLGWKLKLGKWMGFRSNWPRWVNLCSERVRVRDPCLWSAGSETRLKLRVSVLGWLSISVPHGCVS